MKAWARSRFEALQAQRSLGSAAFFVVMAVLDFVPLTWDDFAHGLLWLLVAFSWTEWTYWQHRYRQNEHYIKLGQSTDHKIRIARQRGHDNILITFD